MTAYGPELIAPSTLADLRLAAAQAVPSAAEALAAAELANAGGLDEARTALAAALRTTADITLLFLGFQFTFRTGDLAAAESYVRRRLAAVGEHARTEPAARAWTNLGLIEFTRATGPGLPPEESERRLTQAERWLARAVEISESTGNQRSLARDLGNLALVSEHRRDWPLAESLYRRGLAIAEQIGDAEIAASKFANLGDMAQAQGRPEEARTLWSAALERFRSAGAAKPAREMESRLAGTSA